MKGALSDSKGSSSSSGSPAGEGGALQDKPFDPELEEARLAERAGELLDLARAAGADEAEVFGVDFPRRWSQTREHVQALKALWSEEHPEFHGKYVDFPKVWCHPKPIQQPHPPILIAGELERMAARVADYGDGWIPRGRAIDPAGVEQGRARIAGLYRERGRDPAQLTVSIYGAEPNRESNSRFADAGTDRVVHMLPSKGEAETVQQLEQWAAELL